MRRVVLLLALIVTVGLSARAATVGLSPGEADNLLLLSATGAPTFVDTGVNTYTVAWNQAVVGINTANVGLAVLPPRGVVGDTFEVTIVNDDENTWEFAISTNVGATAFVAIPSNGVHVFSFVLAAAPVNQFALILRGNLPLMGDDRTAEFRVNPSNPIPEPMSMVLLGTGLLGLASAARRRFTRQ